MQTAAQPVPTLSTRVEVAQRLDVSTSYVDRLLARGVAVRSAQTAGGRRLFAGDDVAALAKAIKREDRLGGEAA